MFTFCEFLPYIYVFLYIQISIYIYICIHLNIYTHFFPLISIYTSILDGHIALSARLQSLLGLLCLLSLLIVLQLHGPGLNPAVEPKPGAESWNSLWPI